MGELRAFTNTPITKAKFLKHLNWHKKQDAFISGTYGENQGDQFKGCAVGCSLNSVRIELKDKSISTSDHLLYEKYLGVPVWLARLEDRIFEGLKGDRQKAWPIEFAKAINVGADLDKVKAPFLIFVLQSTLDTFDHEKYPEALQSINSVIDLYTIGEATEEDFREARAAAAAADAADADAAAAAADAADAAAAAADAADAAADAAAAAAAYAAAAAAYAVYAAAAVHAAAVHAAARTARYEMFADKLLEILRESK